MSLTADEYISMTEHRGAHRILRYFRATGALSIQCEQHRMTLFLGSSLKLPAPLLRQRSSQPALANTRCELSQKEPASGVPRELKIGSPVVVVEAPATLKTASSMPSLRVNNGLVKPGDVGRILARKPKDVWAVRLAIGTYLLDGRNFKPLDLDR